LEETHMSDPNRINKLFAVIAVACLLATKAGSLRALFKKIPIKKHGRFEFAVFTYGLDFIRAIFAGRQLSSCDPSIAKYILFSLFLEKPKKPFILGDFNVGY